MMTFGEILSLELPLARPGVVAACRTGRQDTESPPPVPKKAPLGNAEFILTLERAAASAECCRGMRALASGVVLMALASPRHADAETAFDLSAAKAAISGAPRDLKTMGRPILSWADPMSGVHSGGS